MKFRIVEEDLGAVVFDGCQKKIKDRDTGEIKVDRETGYPVWQISALVKQPGSFRAEGIVVNVASKKDPTEGFAPFVRIAFSGLSVSTYVIDGAKVNSFSAEAVSAL